MQQNLDFQNPDLTQTSLSLARFSLQSASRFERQLRLATRLFSIPLAFVVRLVEGRFELFSPHNFEPNELIEEAAICSFLLSPATFQEVLVIEDTKHSSLFNYKVPRRNGEAIQFYAWHVLKNLEGQRIGALVIADYTPRLFSEADTQALTDLAGLVSQELATFPEAKSLLAPEGQVSILENQLKSLEEQTRHVELLFRILAHNIQNGAVFVFDRNLRILMAEGAVPFLNNNSALFEGRLATDIWPDWVGWIEHTYRKTLEGVAVTDEVNLLGRALLVNTSPIRDDNGQPYAGLIIVQDIEDSQRAKKLVSGQTHVLEMLAAGTTLSGVLEQITLIMEELSPRKVFCTIYIVTQLEPNSAPVLKAIAGLRLPEKVRPAARFIPIAPDEGSCGSCAYYREAQIVTDIATDPRWPKYRDVCLEHDLQACWSTPILAKDGTVLGTFAFYYLEKTAPTPDDVNLLDVANHLASIAIEKKLAEEKLATQNEYLSVTLASVADGVISTNVNGQLILLNQVAQQLTGWSGQEAAHRSIEDIFVLAEGEAAAPGKNPLRQALETGAAVNSPKNNILLSKDGSRHHITYTAMPMLTPKGLVNGAVLTFRDITQQYQIEQEMIRAQKLESIGVLAGGIAHDFNNLLAAILGNISLTRLDLEEENPAQEYLEAAEKASLRARDLTQQLLTFARGGNPVKKPTNLTGLIQEASDFTLHGSRVRSFYSLPQDLWAVEGDESQLSQVLQNIIINAIQSMPEGGLIHISAQNTELKENNLSALKPGRYVVVSITDQGMGIAPENLVRIFDPYFTTKTKGHGLGLASAYSIIKNHAGQISVESRVGKGTIFTIYLPAANSGAEIPGKNQAKVTTQTGKKRVLVMDDEPAVRQVAGVMLKKLGYEVYLTAEGSEAVDVFRKALQHDPFDAVVLDLTIPGGMGGEATLQELRKLNPQVKAIASSGYSTDPVMAQHAEYGFTGVLSKPYKLIELDELLQQILVEDF